MKTIIVGGFWGNTPKESSVINKLAEHFECEVYNGGSMAELKEIATTIARYDMIIWMADIANEEDDIRLVKKLGAVMFVSKVLRPNRNRIDAVTRIFKFGANAVVAITKNKDKNFMFELIDALDNTWIKSIDLKELAIEINALTIWTKGAERSGTLKIKNPMETFIDLNRRVADKSAKQNIRYFGNLSTRCTKMMPSFRTTHDSCFVSARNTDKNSLGTDDMIQVTTVNDRLRYFGERKPSVDTPVQMALYTECPEVNYFIHGHTLIENAPTTEHYYPCGDLREVPEILKIMKGVTGVINLKMHGFLLYSDTLENMEKLIDDLKFDVKEL